MALGIVMLLFFRDPAFPAVYAYAYLGIMARRLGEVQSVAVAAAVGAAVFFVLFIVALVHKPRHGKAAG